MNPGRVRAGVPGRAVVGAGIAVTVLALAVEPLALVDHSALVRVFAAFGLALSLPAVRWCGGPWCTAGCVLLATEHIVATLAARSHPVLATVAEAVLLGLLHHLCAIGSVLPRVADVAPAVLGRWVRRTALQLGATAVVSLGLAVLVAHPAGLPQAGLPLALVGLLLAAGAPLLWSRVVSWRTSR